MTVYMHVYNGTARWIKVYPYVEGRLPTVSAGKILWLRADLIEQVEIKQLTGEYTVIVHTANGIFFAHENMLKQEEAENIVSTILNRISDAQSVKNS